MENTTENNKLIAEFMGLKQPYELPEHGTIRPNGDFKTTFEAEQLKYHKSWDWLMPVVEECFNKAEDGEMVDIMHNLQVADKNNTYKAVVEFIKFHNKEKEASHE